MKGQLFPLSQILQIVIAGVAVLGSVLAVPPQFNKTYESDLGRKVKAGQELANQIKQFKAYSNDVVEALENYLFALLLLEGFHLWKGLGTTIRFFRRLEGVTVWVVSISVVLFLTYWALAGGISLAATPYIVKIIRIMAGLSFGLVVMLLAARYRCSRLYNRRLSHLEF